MTDARRILSVWLPNWPTQRLRRSPQDGAPAEVPLATVESVRGLRRLAAVCPMAEKFGLRPEQALAEARAICPDLTVVDADPPADQAALARLAAWCERFSPLAAVCAPDGLWLDIAGCAHFFPFDEASPNGEAGLARDLHARLARAGLDGRIAVAGTAGAAWALARSPTARGDCTIIASGEEREALERLPVALLRLDARIVAGLRRVGLRSIGEMARLPRGELAGRYGAGAMLRLDQAFGRATEAIVWPHPQAPWEERLAFAEPIATPDDLFRALRLLTARLCERLAAGGCGGLAFAARFFRVDDLIPRIAIATAQPVRDPVYVAKLLREKLETVDPGFGVEAMTLSAEAAAPFEASQTRLGDLAAPHRAALAASVDELSNRLGRDRLWRAQPRGSHIPERAFAPSPLAGSERSPPPGTEKFDPSRPRPIRLFRTPEAIEAVALVPDDPPILFRWRGATRRVRAADGPERIEPEWWRGSEGQVRDYYRVEDAEGARFWIFREGKMGDGKMPRWFVHGLFG